MTGTWFICTAARCNAGPWPTEKEAIEHVKNADDGMLHPIKEVDSTEVGSRSILSRAPKVCRTCGSAHTEFRDVVTLQIAPEDRPVEGSVPEYHGVMCTECEDIIHAEIAGWQEAYDEAERAFEDSVDREPAED